MKIKFLSIILILVASVSCSEWLDVYPDSEITSEKVFEDEEGYYSALAGLYVKMTADDLYGFELTSGLLDYMGGNVYVGSGNYLTYHANYFYDNAYYASYVAPLQFPALNFYRGGIYTDATDGQLDDWWTGLYSIIANANVLIETVKEEDASMFEDGVKDLVLAEAMAVKAYIHLDLVRMFQVPYLDADGKTEARIPYMENMDGLQFVPSATTDEILDKVDADLAYAAELMKDVDPISSGKSYYAQMFSSNRQHKLNYYAVKALQARSFLYRGKNQEAYDAAMEVINAADGIGVHFITDAEMATLDSDNVPVNRNCYMENLFAIRKDDLSDTFYSTAIGYSCTYGTFGRMATNPWLNYGESSGVVYFNWAQSDIRYSLWKQPGTSSLTSGMIAKYYHTSTLAADEALYPTSAASLLKLGEVYLIAAEAAAEAVSVAEGVRLLNVLQTARGAALFSGSDKDSFSQEILYEYRREMLGDGQLFYANKRRNEPLLHTLFQTGDTGTPYYFTMTKDRYTPSTPNSEYNGGRTY